MRITAAVVLGMLLASPGCKGKASSVPPPAEPLEYDEPSDAGSPATAEAEERLPGAGGGPEGCPAAGKPWSGKHEGCLYEVGGCCFSDAASACAAAGCEAGTCQVLESSPAQIVCRAG